LEQGVDVMQDIVLIKKTKTIMKNKLLEKSHEEAVQSLKTSLNREYGEIVRFHEPELIELTAELYAIKLLDLSQPKDMGENLYSRYYSGWIRFSDGLRFNETKELHSFLVEEFNKEAK